MLTPTVDSVNLRCFDQKRRFGIDFLYPIQRYVNALRSPSLCTTSDDLSLSAPCAARADGTPGEVKNPLFSDLSGAGGAVRDASMVYLLGIVGVPWQDLAASKDAQGQPFPATELHYQSPADLASNGAWEKILGNDEPGGGAPPIAPTDPHMRPSRDPRPGLPGPSATYMADPINGHEWNIVEGDDLEYACIFALPQTGACSDRNCDCYNLNPADNNPLCQTPGGTYEAVQHFAKAYPGLRELELAKSLGPNGIPASICARNLVTVDAQDYGYGPAMDALGASVGKSIK
jgi:hypothetical protein